MTRHTRIVERALTRLRLLVAVGKHGNILNAAKELSVSQPAATKMIQDLELDFEVKLFDRTNRGVVPTIFGEALIRHGKLIFSQVSNAAQELDDLNEGNSGRVVVGAMQAASPTLLPLAIDKLLAARPNVAVKIVEDTNEVLMPAMMSGEIDVVIGRLPRHRHRENITLEKLIDERTLAVIGAQHPLAQQRNLTFDQLKPFGWILPPIETTLRHQIDQFFIRQGPYVPAKIIESLSYLANRTLLTQHDFIGFLPAHVAELDIKIGLLSAVGWSAPFGAGPVGVSYRDTQNLSPASAAFLGCLRAAAQEISERIGEF